MVVNGDKPLSTARRVSEYDGTVSRSSDPDVTRLLPETANGTPVVTREKVTTLLAGPSASVAVRDWTTVPLETDSSLVAALALVKTGALSLTSVTYSVAVQSAVSAPFVARSLMNAKNEPVPALSDSRSMRTRFVSSPVVGLSAKSQSEVTADKVPLVNTIWNDAVIFVKKVLYTDPMACSSTRENPAQFVNLTATKTLHISYSLEWMVFEAKLTDR